MEIKGERTVENIAQAVSIELILRDKSVANDANGYLLSQALLELDRFLQLRSMRIIDLFRYAEFNTSGPGAFLPFGACAGC